MLARNLIFDDYNLFILQEIAKYLGPINHLRLMQTCRTLWINRKFNEDYGRKMPHIKQIAFSNGRLLILTEGGKILLQNEFDFIEIPKVNNIKDIYANDLFYVALTNEKQVLKCLANHIEFSLIPGLEAEQIETDLSNVLILNNKGDVVTLVGSKDLNNSGSAIFNVLLTEPEVIPFAYPIFKIIKAKHPLFIDSNEKLVSSQSLHNIMNEIPVDYRKITQHVINTLNSTYLLLTNDHMIALIHDISTNKKIISKKKTARQPAHLRNVKLMIEMKSPSFIFALKKNGSVLYFQAADPYQFSYIKELNNIAQIKLRGNNSLLGLTLNGQVLACKLKYIAEKKHFLIEGITKLVYPKRDLSREKMLTEAEYANKLNQLRELGKTLTDKEALDKLEQQILAQVNFCLNMLFDEQALEKKLQIINDHLNLINQTIQQRIAYNQAKMTNAQQKNATFTVNKIKTLSILRFFGKPGEKNSKRQDNEEYRKRKTANNERYLNYKAELDNYELKPVHELLTLKRS